jgi:hypothetical protein
LKGDITFEKGFGVVADDVILGEQGSLNEIYNKQSSIK